MSLKRKDTPENKAYWEHVEKTAAEVRRERETGAPCASCETLRHERDEARCAVLEAAARVAFVCGTDTPDTERRARAVLIQRLANQEAQLTGLREALEQLANRWKQTASSSMALGINELSRLQLCADELMAALASPEATKPDVNFGSSTSTGPSAALQQLVEKWRSER